MTNKDGRHVKTLELTKVKCVMHDTHVVWPHSNLYLTPCPNLNVMWENFYLHNLVQNYACRRGQNGMWVQGHHKVTHSSLW